MSVNLKTYGLYVKTEIAAQAQILAAAIPIYLIDNSAAKEIEEVIKELMGNEKNGLFITAVRIAEKIQKYSGQKQYYRLQCDIISVVNAGENLSMTDRNTVPAFGSPAAGIDCNTLASYVQGKLDYNKLTGDYLEYGGEIIEQDQPIDVDNSMHYIRQVHEGRLKD